MWVHVCVHTRTDTPTPTDKGQWRRGRGNTHQIWNEWVFRDLIKNTTSVVYRDKVYLGNYLEANWLVLDTLGGCIRRGRTCRVNVSFRWYMSILRGGNKWMGNIKWCKILDVEGISGSHLVQWWKMSVNADEEGGHWVHSREGDCSHPVGEMLVMIMTFPYSFLWRASM